MGSSFVRYSRSREYLFVTFVTAVGLAIRLFRIDYPALWLDEGTTFAMARQPIEELFGPRIVLETSPPVYYSLQHFWLFFGDSRTALRSLPLMFGVLTIPLCWLLGRKVGGIKVGLITAVLICTAPLFIHYSREIRGYSMLFFSVSLALVCILYLLPSSSRAENEIRSWSPGRVALWITYTLSSALAIHSHNSAILFLVVMTVFSCWLLYTEKLSFRFWVRWMIFHAIVIAIYSWWILVILHQLELMSNDYWIEETSLRVVKSQYLGVYPYWKYAKPIMFVLGLYGLIVLYKQSKKYASLAMFILVGQPALLLLISFYSPVFIRRALVWPSILYFVLVAIALAKISNVRLLAFALSGVIFIQLAAAVRDFPPQKEPDYMAEIVDVLDIDNKRDLLVIAPQLMDKDLQNAIRNEPLTIPVYGLNAGDRPLSLEAWFISKRVNRSELIDKIAGRERIWFILETKPLFEVSEEEGFSGVLNQLKSKYVLASEEVFEHHSVYLFTNQEQVKSMN